MLVFAAVYEVVLLLQGVELAVNFVKLFFFADGAVLLVIDRVVKDVLFDDGWLSALSVDLGDLHFELNELVLLGLQKLLVVWERLCLLVADVGELVLLLW